MKSKDDSSQAYSKIKQHKKTVFENINILESRSRIKKACPKEIANPEDLNYDLKEVKKKNTKSVSTRKLSQNNNDSSDKRLMVENEYAHYIDHKLENTPSTLNKTREDAVDDYRLEQRFPDDLQAENTEEQLAKLAYIKEETAESHSSEEGRRKVSLIHRKRQQIKDYQKLKRKSHSIVNSQSLGNKDDNNEIQ